MLNCMEILAIAAKREIRVYAIKGNWHLDETIQSKIMGVIPLTDQEAPNMVWHNMLSNDEPDNKTPSFLKWFG